MTERDHRGRFPQQPFIRSTSYLAGELLRIQGSVKCEAVWMSDSRESCEQLSLWPVHNTHILTGQCTPSLHHVFVEVLFDLLLQMFLFE